MNYVITPDFSVTVNSIMDVRLTLRVKLRPGPTCEADANTTPATFMPLKAA